MKKMLMLLAAVVAVSLANAASVNWVIDLGKTDYANKNYYIFDSSKSADVLSALAAVDDSTAKTLSGMALASGTLNSKAGKATGNGLDVGSVTELMFVAVKGDGIADGSAYIYGSLDVSSALYTPPATAPAAFTANAANMTKSGTMSASAGGGVPEPTSGLLLLIGGAMLALRRKQK